MSFEFNSLDEVADVVDSLHKTPTYSETGYPMVRGTDVKYGTLDLSSTFKVAETVYLDFSRKYKPSPKDIIITRVGTYGVTAQVKEINFCLGQNTAAIIPSQINADYLFYVLNSPYLKSQIESGVVGSTQKTLSLKVIKSFKIPRFDKSSEAEIASILSSLDKRISLLRETNTTLEAIAQTLFKSWFVDFDPVKSKAEGKQPEGMDEATAALFPSEFEESALGLIPKGWRVGVLSDCCKKVESGGTPKRNNSEYWDGDIGWLTSGEVRSSIVLDTKEKITSLGVKESSAKIWPIGTTVVAMYGATAGEVCLLAKAVTANQACCGLIPLNEARAFLFFITRRESKNLADKSSGSAQQNLNKGLVSNHKILLPPLNISNLFESIAGILIDKWIENEKQSQTLTTLRDTLLPRLISGQLRINQAQDVINEVGA